MIERDDGWWKGHYRKRKTFKQTIGRCLLCDAKPIALPEELTCGINQGHYCPCKRNQYLKRIIKEC